jgi:hypothetical protein
MLRLLRLYPDVLASIKKLGDPQPFPVVTERTLRPVVNAKAEIQKEMVERILADLQAGSGRGESF